MNNNYTFSNHDDPMFSAIKFNGQIFAKGRGLFIHIMKYFPSLAKQAIETSRSELEWNPENFSKATHRHAGAFKGISFEYVRVDKKHRDAIRQLSKAGEGWWPSRGDLLKPGIDYELTFHNFMMNYENPPHYTRRLGRGLNVSIEERYELQSGVDFSRRGFAEMKEQYQKYLGRDHIFIFELPGGPHEYYFIRKFGFSNEGFREYEYATWRRWTIAGEGRRKDYDERIKQYEILNNLTG